MRLKGKKQKSKCPSWRSREVRKSEMTYKKECQEKSALLRRNADFFLDIQPNCLDVGFASSALLVLLDTRSEFSLKREAGSHASNPLGAQQCSEQRLD